ncbi:GGDEF domain-containing protein [Bordetella sp. FB-8]|uniref:GGDEF domain-containing protein n=1 Tax=Bordetella sp. FB-8 TaxID=1159870 RepID=UPI001E458F3B|nr:GGDEF domain-containing protein [Bordetella sp. FB-8]
MAFVLGLLGTYTHISALSLSVFWPANVTCAALIHRYGLARKPASYIIAYAGLALQDCTHWGWSLPPFLFNAADLVFVLVLALWLSRSRIIRQGQNDVAAFFHLILACLAASAACAAVGGPMQQATPYAYASLTQAVFGWFTEQFYTSILCLPFLLSLFGGKVHIEHPISLTWRSTLPLLSLLVSIGLSLSIGPFLILMLVLPALTWCAISYPVWLVQLITLGTGCVQLIIASIHVPGLVDMWGRSVPYMLSVLRLGIAAAIFGPLLIAINMSTIRRLNLKLRQQASYDFLTSTLSRFGLADALSRYTTLREYRDTRMNIMLIDVDHFKRINDSLGHACGDLVLKHIAAVVHDTVPEPRLISRIGGEEFMVVCFGYEPPVFYALADTVRRAIADTPLKHERRDVLVTISIGIAYSEQAGINLEKTLWSLFPHADHNLYTAKREGRNRTVQ